MRTEIERSIEIEPTEPGIIVIRGSMFGRKSDMLINALKGIPYQKKTVLAFKPDVDSRRGKDTINSASGATHPAISVPKALDILTIVEKTNPMVDVVAIDETQFFDPDIVKVCETLAAEGKCVIAAGLDLDFRGEPFGPMGRLVQIATHTVTGHAYCALCGKEASRTQRLVDENGVKRPAHYNEPIILVGAQESYEARCLKHHEVPGRPDFRIKETLYEGPIRFYLCGIGEAEDLIEKILIEHGHSVYRPVFNEKEKDIDLLTNQAREERGKCKAAIFGPGQPPQTLVIGDLNEGKTNRRTVGIQAVRDWGNEVGGPSLALIRNLVGEYNAPSKALYTLAYGYMGPEYLKEQLLSFILEARKRIK